MLNMIEQMKRGGLSVLGNNVNVKANNQHMPDHDKTEPHISTARTTANLYGCSMAECLHHKDLKFDKDIELHDTLSTPTEHETG